MPCYNHALSLFCMYEIPQWVKDLKTPNPQTIKSINEQCFPQVIEYLESQLPTRIRFLRRRSQQAVIDVLGTENVESKITEDETDEWSSWTKKLGFHFVAQTISRHHVFRALVPEPQSLAIIERLEQGQRDELANALTKELCTWCVTVPNRYSLKHEVGRRAFRMTYTFHNMLPEMHEKIRHPDQETTKKVG